MEKLKITRSSSDHDELVELYKKEKYFKLKERYHAFFLMHEFMNCTITSAGEIGFHTTLVKFESTNVDTQKRGDLRQTELYQTNTQTEDTGEDIFVRRILLTQTTTTTHTTKTTVVVQKDLDLDGYIDIDVTYETTKRMSISTTYTTETNEFYEGKTKYLGTIKEYRNSTIFNSDKSNQFIFRDYEGDEITSVRIYEDVFPNELSEKYNMDNYEKTVINDNNDADPSNDLVLQAPALENLLSFTHTTDNVPAIFDRRTTINSPAVIDNILEIEAYISIPDSKTNLPRSTATLNVIEVIPDDGKVIIDSNPRKGPYDVELNGGKYLHYSSGQDGNYDQVFVVNEAGEVLAINIDYDYNFFVEPNKKILTEKHILSTDIVDGNVKYLIRDSRVYMRDSKKHDGIFLELTFTDSLFDIWKTAYTSSTSQLMKEIKSITSKQFIQSVKGRIVGDIAFQIAAQLTAFIASVVIAAALQSIPVLGQILGAVGYALVYGLISAWKASEEARKNARDMASFTLNHEDYDGPVTISERDTYSALWGETLPNIVGYSTGGVYIDTLLETDEHLFKGKLVLAPKGVRKTSNLGMVNIPIAMDYGMQKGGYTMYSDFDDPRLSPYFEVPSIKEIMASTYAMTLEDAVKEYNKEADNLDPEMQYLPNSIMFLEKSISKLTEGEYDTLYPYITYGQGTFVPSFQFGGSSSRFPIPEYYRDYPIYVDDSYYPEVSGELSNIYKVFDASSSQIIELLPEDAIHVIRGNIPLIEATLIDKDDNEIQVITFKALDENSVDERFTFDSDLATITIGYKMYNTLQEKLARHKNSHFILKVGVARYRSISDVGDMTQEEVSHIATMQAIDQTLLEYGYQFTHAQKTQQGLSEMFYTVMVTVISTIFTTAITLGVGFLASKTSSMTSATNKLVGEGGQQLSKAAYKEALKGLKFMEGIMHKLSGTLSSAGLISVMLSPVTESLQEIFVDPYLETIVTDIAAKWGWDTFGQVLASSLASASRETSMGSMSQFIFQSSQQTDTSGIIDTRHKQSFITSEQLAIQGAIDSKISLEYRPEVSTFIRGGLSLLIGAALVGMGGPLFLGASVGMGLSSMVSITEDLKVVKTITRNIVGHDTQTNEEIAYEEAIDIGIDQGIDLIVEQAQVSSTRSRPNIPKNIIQKTSIWRKIGRKISHGIPYILGGIASFITGAPISFNMVKTGDGETKIWLEDHKLIRTHREGKKRILKMASDLIFNLNILVKGELTKYAGKGGNSYTNIATSLGLKALWNAELRILRGDQRAMTPETIKNLRDSILQFLDKKLRDGIEKNLVLRSKTRIIKDFNNYGRFSVWMNDRKLGKAMRYKKGDPSTNKLEARSSLIENIREIFPKYKKIRISNSHLSKILFGDLGKDSLKHGEFYLTKFFLRDNGAGFVSSRPDLSKLMSMDFRINNPRMIKTMKDLGLNFKDSDFKKFQTDFSKLIKEFVFKDFYDIPYFDISEFRGTKLDLKYYDIKYNFMRNFYFLAAESMQLFDEPPVFATIARDFIPATGKTHLTNYWTQGTDFSVEKVNSFSSAIEGAPRNIFWKQAKESFTEYITSIRTKRNSVIGGIAHHRLEFLILEFLESLGFVATSELQIRLIDKFVKGNTRPDTLVLNERELFAKLLMKNKDLLNKLGIKIPKNVKHFVFDFTLSKAPKVINDKRQKFYQHDPDRFLFIVVYGMKGMNKVAMNYFNEDVRNLDNQFKESHVRIITIDNLLEMLGITGELKQSFDDFNKDVSSALRTDPGYDTLLDEKEILWRKQIESKKKTQSNYLNYLNQMP